MTESILLHQNPHPVHSKMAEEIGASKVRAAQINHLHRTLFSALTSYYSGPVIIEGGMPLLEGALLKIFNNIEGPLILLAADETQLNLHGPSLDYISRYEEIIHRFSHEFIDGVIAVSDNVAEATRALIDDPVKVSEPFIEYDRYNALCDCHQPSSPEQPLQVLNVGEYKPGNGQDLLIDALEYSDTNMNITFVGPDTNLIKADRENVDLLGFADENTLIEEYCNADLLVFSGRTGAFPVVTLEAWRAGLPTLVTDRIGTAPYVQDIESNLVVECNPKKIADGIDWYSNQSTEYKTKISSEFCGISGKYFENRGRERFKRTYNELLKELGYA